MKHDIRFSVENNEEGELFYAAVAVDATLEEHDEVKVIQGWSSDSLTGLFDLIHRTYALTPEGKETPASEDDRALDRIAWYLGEILELKDVEEVHKQHGTTGIQRLAVLAEVAVQRVRELEEDRMELDAADEARHELQRRVKALERVTDARLRTSELLEVRTALDAWFGWTRSIRLDYIAELKKNKAYGKDVAWLLEALEAAEFSTQPNLAKEVEDFIREVSRDIELAEPNFAIVSNLIIAKYRMYEKANILLNRYLDHIEQQANDIPEAGSIRATIRRWKTGE